MKFSEIVRDSGGTLIALNFLKKRIKTIKEKNSKKCFFAYVYYCENKPGSVDRLSGLQTDWVIILTNTIVLAMSLTMIF